MEMMRGLKPLKIERRSFFACLNFAIIINEQGQYQSIVGSVEEGNVRSRMH